MTCLKTITKEQYEFAKAAKKCAFVMMTNEGVGHLATVLHEFEKEPIGLDAWIMAAIMRFENYSGEFIKLSAESSKNGKNVFIQILPSFFEYKLIDL